MTERAMTIAECCFEDLLREGGSLQDWRNELARCRQQLSPSKVAECLAVAISAATPEQVTNVMMELLSGVEDER